ncbi:hypothetical protein Pr1d_34270 [Bythopirellula goksoeyrii]|uniref:Uncharacterized protein n=1 Tax=Bythopirellula goksoeyrii TaxID=1400387 RepID=A0A5B9QB18_9BACT|nr:hypothetical protein Pr1d_34270 [Bythopirellula goksoeyrii]
MAKGGSVLPIRRRLRTDCILGCARCVTPTACDPAYPQRCHWPKHTAHTLQKCLSAPGDAPSAADASHELAEVKITKAILL